MSEQSAPVRRFRVKATGETGIAVGKNGFGHVIHYAIAIGAENNVQLIDLYDNETGEIRTFRATHLEEITE